VDDALRPPVLEDRPPNRGFVVPLVPQVLREQVEVPVQVLEREELLGRPLLWALAVEAADEALALLDRELRDAMLLAGCADLAAVRELTVGRAAWPISS
jgi:hypothetical protein